MAPKTDSAPAAIDGIEDFYDALAPDYDLMTDPGKRFIREKPFLHLIAGRYRITRALDAGSGTGFHSFALARLGVSVVAVDRSSTMLEQLKQIARREKLPIQTLRSGFSDLAGHVDPPVDAVFCMGNTVAHLVDDAELAAALSGFASVMKPGGLLAIQLLNYDRILNLREPVLNRKAAGGRIFTRSYRYDDPMITFTITTEDADTGRLLSERTIVLRPIRPGELAEALTRAGFRDQHQYGSIALDPFIPNTSQDCVVLARKPVTV